VGCGCADSNGAAQRCLALPKPGRVHQRKPHFGNLDCGGQQARVGLERPQIAVVRALQGTQPDSAAQSQWVPHLRPGAAFLRQSHPVARGGDERPVGPCLPESGTSLAEIGIGLKLAQSQPNPAGPQRVGPAQALEIGR